MRIIDQSGTHSYNFDDMDIFVYDRALQAVHNGRTIQLGVFDSEEEAREEFLDVHDSVDKVYPIHWVSKQ